MVPELDYLLGGASASVEQFEVAFAHGQDEQRLPLTMTLSVPFESCRPVRDFPSYKGQRHYSGRWWTATTGTLVGYESWLERDTLVMLDFDADVVGIASQPFWLFWIPIMVNPARTLPTTSLGSPTARRACWTAALLSGSSRVVPGAASYPLAALMTRPALVAVCRRSASAAAFSALGWVSPSRLLRISAPRWARSIAVGSFSRCATRAFSSRT